MGSRSVPSCDSNDKNRPEDDKYIVETCSLIITFSNRFDCADVHCLILLYDYKHIVVLPFKSAIYVIYIYIKKRRSGQFFLTRHLVHNTETETP